MPILALLLAAAVQVETPMDPHLQPLGFLVGSCWRGTFPGSTRTDTHCFTRTPDGNYLRDRHVVAGDAQPYSGVTFYRWDEAAGSLAFDYYPSDGAYASGMVRPAENGLAFPDTIYRAGDGTETHMRSAWTRDGADAYVALTEAQRGGRWQPMWELLMVRVGPAPPD